MKVIFTVQKKVLLESLIYTEKEWVLFVAKNSSVVANFAMEIEEWVLDSNTTLHSTSSRNIINYVVGRFGTIYNLEDGALDIIGKDNVELATSNGMVLHLKGVPHILGLTRNLISTG